MKTTNAVSRSELRGGGPVRWLTRALPLVGVALLGVTVCQIQRAGAAREASAADAARAASAPARGTRAEGRLVTYPGAEVSVGAEVGGRIALLDVVEKRAVTKGQVLAELDADEERAALAEARARVAESEADLRWAEAEFGRVRNLSGQGALAPQALDRARRERDAAEARRALARSAVERLEAALAKTRIVAPIDGVVVERAANAGEIVEPGAPLFTIADLTRTRIEADVDEFDAARVALGDPVEITVEGITDRSWRGVVEEIPDSVVSRRLRPLDPGRPTDTRVLIVKIALTEPTPIKLGQRVELAIGAASPPLGPS
ncbi:MAG: efflux RND transporter periplasmic adaptor subunit [Deltaproteobacteria bacterium]|nr:efflux RND transporter periplasmic adaptor subunit [Deltaproteobacteria bacterium]